MKFYGEPNLVVTHRRKIGLTNTFKLEKVCEFDEKGEFETENVDIIKLMDGKFKSEATEAPTNDFPDKMVCKHCGEEFTNKGLLMAHYRKHKKEDK